jgi:hypothetical protein
MLLIYAGSWNVGLHDYYSSESILLSQLKTTGREETLLCEMGREEFCANQHILA